MNKTNILKGKTAKIAAGVLTGCLLVGAVCGIMGVFNKDKADTIHPIYSVGALTEQGKYLETKESIYTKNAFACEGLKITMDFDNDISYQVYYYDFDSNFIEKSAILTENYKDGVPFNAQTARIVITPNEDDEITWLEINGYANQLKVEVDKEQFETYEDKLENLDFDKITLTSALFTTETGKVAGESGTLTESSGYNSYVYNVTKSGFAYVDFGNLSTTGGQYVHIKPDGTAVRHQTGNSTSFGSSAMFAVSSGDKIIISATPTGSQSFVGLFVSK